MTRRLWTLLTSACLLGALGSSPVRGQEIDARWIWHDNGEPGVEAPKGKVWFRAEFRADEPSTGRAVVACDDEFVLFVNGQRIGAGGGQKSFRFSLSGIVERGVNVFAVEAVNRGGRAGLLVDAEIRGQSGQIVSADTGGEWSSTVAEPVGNDWLKPQGGGKTFQPVRVIGRHQESPWKQIELELREADRFQVPAGFKLERIAGHELVGSLVTMTWGNRGALLASREGGPILVVTDDNGDGTYDNVQEYCADVRNCQGLCMVFEDLYAVGEGPQGAGLYRLPDRNQDGRADAVALIAAHRGGMAEHGPHAVLLGPDGWLYHNLGNHAWVQKTVDPASPRRGVAEDDLLEPRLEDAGGHAVGIKAPGGTIWRLSRDGAQWWLEANGFRNAYDMAINGAGHLFSFDSDMEWDVGLPWYRPVRVNHCIPGAEFGWRSGAAKWPAHFLDSLPGAVDVGRGSPTGLVFYEHVQFPERFRGAMMACDWSMGRVLAVFLKPNGAGFQGSFETLVAGNPLNVTDIEVDRDGSVVFCTGGRKTEGGIYRLTFLAGAMRTPKVPRTATIEDVLAMPQPQSGWAREAAARLRTQLGTRWGPTLVSKIQTGSNTQRMRALSLLCQLGPRPDAALLRSVGAGADAELLQFVLWLLAEDQSAATARFLADQLSHADATVQRRACEAFIRLRLEPPHERLLELLSSRDRTLRYAARLALERVDPAKWKNSILYRRDLGDQAMAEGVLALLQLGPEALSPDVAMKRIEPWLKVASTPQAPDVQLAMLRLCQLALLRGAQPAQISAEARQGLLALAAGANGGAPAAQEAARILARLQEPAAVPVLIEQLGRASREQQIHFALCLSYLAQGWSPALIQRYFNWYESTGDWEGGNSLQGYLRNISAALLDRATAEQRRDLAAAWRGQPRAARLVLWASRPEQIAGFEELVAGMLQELQTDAAANPYEYVGLAIEALGKSALPPSQAFLRRLFEEHADQRPLVTRALARHPIAENVPYLIKGMALRDATASQLCIEALLAAEFAPNAPSALREAILAGLRLGPRGGKAALQLLQKWTGNPFDPLQPVEAALAGYQSWFAKNYPDEPPAVPPQEDVSKTGYTVDRVADFLQNDPAAARAEAARGRVLFFGTAQCAKCHRFGVEGEGIGPDLTTIRRRFQKREIVESIILPSQVVSDQYAAVTVVTRKGSVHTGLPLPSGSKQKVLLLLPDATRLELDADDVEERATSKVSIMPEGLLKGLTLADIADLFAFLETSRAAPPLGPPAKTPGAAGR
jgi:putative heme-binding domain-containing protein